MRPRRAITAMLGLTLLFAGTACGTSSASDSDTLVFAAIPSEQDSDPRQSYATVIERLEANTGREVEFKQTTNYNGVIEGMKSGTIDVAVFGPFSYVLARTVGAEITPVAVSVEDTKEPIYHSYGIAKGDDASVKSLKDFKGKKVCFVDPASTSGYLFPSAGLEQNDLDPDKDVQKVMAGGHDLSVMSVKSGKCDVGFASDTMVDTTMPDAGKLKKGEIKVVWRSTGIPSSPVAMRDALPEDVRKGITTSFTKQLNKDWLVKNGKCDDAKSCLVAGESAIWGYLPITDKAYDPIRKVCNVTQDEQCKGES